MAGSDEESDSGRRLRNPDWLSRINQVSRSTVGAGARGGCGWERSPVRDAVERAKVARDVSLEKRRESRQGQRDV
jgi:hypothetical protein